ncbi:MAG: hypothetical protein NC320_04075 [Clostridium sp.]|nr:hypothetical protein [Clostridium sp.]MCM1547243.1 hypothetical protein [Ruminococcus sp.]
MKLIIFAVSHILSSLLGKLLTFLLKIADDHQFKIRSCSHRYENEAGIYKSIFYAGLIFCILAVFFGSPVIFSDNVNEKIEGLICFLIVIPLGLIPIIIYLNVKYNYDSYSFSYRNFFRKKYEYYYFQISDLNSKPYGLKIRMSDGKKFYILSSLINDEEKIINTMIKYMED